MVTMKMLSNNRGVALIILVIAMTLIAVLGASFVALVGSKHRSFTYQRDSYRALNLANAGVEYAIRYVSDSLRNAGSTFFEDPTTFQTASNPVVINMLSAQSFSFYYDYSAEVLSTQLCKFLVDGQIRTYLSYFRCPPVHLHLQ